MGYQYYIGSFPYIFQKVVVDKSNEVKAKKGVHKKNGTSGDLTGENVLGEVAINGFEERDTQVSKQTNIGGGSSNDLH